jgi:hypothetical protein
MADSLRGAVRKFPRRVEQFANDDRIAFDKAKDQWILEDEDGKEWAFYESVGKWTQSVSTAQLSEMLNKNPSLTPASAVI